MEHYKAANHLLWYLRRTTDLCLSHDTESGKRTSIPLVYADTDWGGCADTRRSTTDYVFKVFGSVVAWRARRQPTVSLPTAEAEYMASSDATKQNTWFRRLLADLRNTLDSATMLYNDNMGANFLSKNPVYNERLEHISLQYH